MENILQYDEIGIANVYNADGKFPLSAGEVFSKNSTKYFLID